MNGTTHLNIGDINKNLICILCGGYYIDATTAIECLHSFCRTCIVTYLMTSKTCPVCDTVVHKTRPHQNIRSDKLLQDLVYKLVPGLYKDEMRRRREFYTRHYDAAPKRPGEERGDEMSDRFAYTEEEKISIALHFCREGATERADFRRVFSSREEVKTRVDNRVKDAVDVRYLQCKAAVTVGHLKKFVRLKYGMPSHCQVSMFYNDEPLRSSWTLCDVAYLFSWRRRAPLILTFCVSESTRKHPSGREATLQTTAIFIKSEPGTETVGHSFTVPAVKQASSAVKQTSSAPAVKQTPTAPAVKQTPTAPAVKQTPTAPAVKQTPTAPAVKQTPTAPAVKQLPTAPAVKQIPTAPAVKQLPTTPAVKQTLSTPAVKQTSSAPAVKQTPSSQTIKQTPAVSISISPMLSAVPSMSAPASPRTSNPGEPRQARPKGNARSSPSKSVSELPLLSLGTTGSDRRTLIAKSSCFGKRSASEKSSTTPSSGVTVNKVMKLDPLPQTKKPTNTRTCKLVSLLPATPRVAAANASSLLTYHNQPPPTVSLPSIMTSQCVISCPSEISKTSMFSVATAPTMCQIVVTSTAPTFPLFVASLASVPSSYQTISSSVPSYQTISTSAPSSYQTISFKQKRVDSVRASLRPGKQTSKHLLTSPLPSLLSSSSSSSNVAVAQASHNNSIRPTTTSASSTPTAPDSSTSTSTASSTPAASASSAPTAASTPTVSVSSISTASASSTPTASFTPAVSASSTPTVSASSTPTVSASSTPTVSASSTPTVSASSISTASASSTPAAASSPTPASSASPRHKASTSPTPAASASPSPAAVPVQQSQTRGSDASSRHAHSNRLADHTALTTQSGSSQTRHRISTDSPQARLAGQPLKTPQPHQPGPGGALTESQPQSALKTGRVVTNMNSKNKPEVSPVAASSISTPVAVDSTSPSSTGTSISQDLNPPNLVNSPPTSSTSQGTRTTRKPPKQKKIADIANTLHKRVNYALLSMVVNRSSSPSNRRSSQSTPLPNKSFSIPHAVPDLLQAPVTPLNLHSLQNFPQNGHLFGNTGPSQLVQGSRTEEPLNLVKRDLPTLRVANGILILEVPQSLK